ncbi:ead/Ea22-like family protein [Klebsiella pneumoniae]|nr:ead/Ea22-like family protein [Klebsiella pneumoniae]HBT4592418.1 ead/Ea22-like family protein [Klebsiella pneumoniae]HBX5523852.1 ead/Ea22-like family protein [Klebsiella pneumoniae]HBY5293068.1 ead/Ea22-like family protein [Klebsiella pneumoniae]HEE5209325.1 ead/Ea22-like family protein [Klebsiella pneumoniae]
MTDITELTAEKLEEIRQRYRPTLAPKCHICGVEMTIQRMSASRITYGCAGAIYDETGCHYAEGRSLADDHYAESRITVVDVSDPDVFAMVEALEKAQAQSSKWLEAYHKAVSIGARYEEHIAELESRAVKLPKKNIGWDRDEEDCWNNAIDACAEVLAAAGIKVEAE